MDGSNREVLASKSVNENESIYWPVSLTFHKETNKLYWLDVLSQTVNSITLDDIKVRAQMKVFENSQSIAIIAGKIFWSDNLKNTIEVANINSSDFKR